jgi:hypothetical protein
MNREIQQLLAANIGRSASIYFYGTDDDTFRSGVIKAVTDSLVTLRWKDRSETGREEITTTYSDIAQIRTVMLNEPSVFDENDYLIRELSGEIEKTHQ